MQEVAHHVEDRTVEHGEAGLDRAVPDRLHEMAFPGSRRPHPENGAGLTNEPTHSQVVDLLPVDGRIEREVKVLERTVIAEPGGFDASLDEPVGAHGQFVLEDQLQELGMGERVAGRFLKSHVERLGQARETQLSQRGLHGFVHGQHS